MFNLFYLDENYEVVVKPEALSLKPFKDVMDKYKKKSYGTTELTYIFHMIDYRTDYDDVVDLNERSKTILKNLVGAENIIVDEITQAAITFYDERQPSITHKHLQAVKKSLKGLQDALDNINMTTQTLSPNGDVVDVYDTMALKRIAEIITASPKIIAAIKDMEKQVKTELQENNAHRGSGEKSIYEDG
jgi:hypothetical protein